jgi:hypothetical protein
MRDSWPAITTIVAVFSTMMALLSCAGVLIGVVNPVFSLNENQILYLFSTSAQVLAGIYGLTLSGFVFFRNELSREEFEDETLVDAVERLKKRYFLLLVFITALVVIALLLANLAIAEEGSGHPYLTVAVINTAQSAFVTSLLAVAYFVYEVISPQRIEAASKGLQEELDPTRKEEVKGSLEDFLRNYNEIEMLLAKYGQIYQEGALALYQNRAARRLSNVRLAEMLFRTERIDLALFNRLKALISLRNSIIHGADPVVSTAVVAGSRQILEDLRRALEAER